VADAQGVGLAILAVLVGAVLVQSVRITRRLDELVQSSRVGVQPRLVVEHVESDAAGLVATIRNVGIGPALRLRVRLDGTPIQAPVAHLSGSDGAVLVRLGIANLQTQACLQFVYLDALGLNHVERIALLPRASHIQTAPFPPEILEEPRRDTWGRLSNAAQNIGTSHGWLRQLRQRLLLTTIVALNMVFAGLWWWSSSGYTTRVVAEVSGSHYHVLLDGRQIADGDMAGPASGGIGVRMRGAGSLPTGAGTPRIRFVEVTDMRTGEQLLRDDFSGNEHLWVGDLIWPEGRVPDAGGRLISQRQDWTDYRVDLVLENPIDVSLILRYTGDGTNVHFDFRPWRELDSALVAQEDGANVGRLATADLRMEPIQTLRGILAVALRPYVWLLLVSLFIAGGLGLIGRRLPARATPSSSVPRRWAWPHTSVAVAISLIAFGGLAYAQTVYLERIPHVPDSAVYLFQAKMFASGMVAAPAPPVADAFEVFGSYLVPHRGLWLSQYPFAHPLLLAVGQRFGAAWLVAPVVGGLSVLMVFWIGRTAYSLGVGILAAVLLFASPFFQMSNLDYMSHSTGALFLLAAVIGLLYFEGDRSPQVRVAAGAAAGVTLGLLFNTRPLTGVVAVLVTGVFVTIYHFRKWRTPELLALVSTGGLMFVAYLTYNTYTMGSPFATPYTLSNTASLDNLGFWGHHTIEHAFSNVYTSLTMLEVVLFAWPANLASLLWFLPFLLGSTNRYDYFFGALSLGIVIAWFFYIDPFIMYGPRFWYEMTPLLVLLSARGVSLGVKRGERLVRVLAGRSALEYIVRAFATAAVAGLVVVSVWQWWGPRNSSQPSYAFVPQNVRDLRSFNSTDARILNAVAAAGVHYAVVLVSDDCQGWWCFGSVFPQNDPQLDTDVVYARDRSPELTTQLRQLYPDRAFYRATYTEPSEIKPLDL
jgi:hypothetical protein